MSKQKRKSKPQRHSNQSSLQKCKNGHAVFKDSCSQCLSLKNEWYNYLKNTGFYDIEKKSDHLPDAGSSFDLNQRISFKYEGARDAVSSYYSWARTCLNEATFKDERDKAIWEYHTEGIGRRQIAPRVGLAPSWCGKKVNSIKEYLKAQAFDVSRISQGSMSALLASY